MKAEMIKAILEMDTKDLNNALNSLGDNDKDIIQGLALEMEEGMKFKRAHNKRKVMFGYWSSLELLAKLGIFLDENRVVK